MVDQLRHARPRRRQLRAEPAEPVDDAARQRRVQRREAERHLPPARGPLAGRPPRRQLQTQRRSAARVQRLAERRARAPVVAAPWPPVRLLCRPAGGARGVAVREGEQEAAGGVLRRRGVAAEHGRGQGELRLEDAALGEAEVAVQLHQRGEGRGGGEVDGLRVVHREGRREEAADDHLVEAFALKGAGRDHTLQRGAQPEGRRGWAGGRARRVEGRRGETCPRGSAARRGVQRRGGGGRRSWRSEARAAARRLLELLLALREEQADLGDRDAHARAQLRRRRRRTLLRVAEDRAQHLALCRGERRPLQRVGHVGAALPAAEQAPPHAPRRLHRRPLPRLDVRRCGALLLDSRVRLGPLAEVEHRLEGQRPLEPLQRRAVAVRQAPAAPPRAPLPQVERDVPAPLVAPPADRVPRAARPRARSLGADGGARPPPPQARVRERRLPRRRPVLPPDLKPARGAQVACGGGEGAEREGGEAEADAGGAERRLEAG
mmetsp:Transcript_27831/g.81760  ORF Transcript_27831/g.81760 Transcript_27831/m.81760 type:complete len:492 (-) Transcript_27831:1111-2586(-)